MKYLLLFLLAAICYMGHPASAQSIQTLRNSSSQPGGVYYITDQARQGTFIYDPSDKSSLDDSVMTLVAANGARYKRIFDQDKINARWFGATGDGRSDDWYSLQKAINYIINSNVVSRTLYLPSGTYNISKPLLIARLNHKTYGHSSISLEGPANSKTISAGYANICPTFNNTFAIGIQSGKGVLIKNLIITGQFTFPHKLNAIQVDTLSFVEWTDGACRQNPISPYSGIAIDPFSDSTAYPKNADMYPGLHSWCPAGLNRSGSTNVQIIGCSIQNFVVGVMITPSYQQNGELIDVIDCDISWTKVAYAMSQAQSKECHVSRLKCWGPTHTVFDNVTYGIRRGDGGGIPMVDGVNLASMAKQLCNIQASSFSGVFRNVYAEGLFRLGFVGGNATVSFEDCQLDFSSQSQGIPYPDFYVLGGGATFHGCMLRLYPGVKGARLVLSGTNNYYEGGTTNAPPVVVNIDNNGVYPYPTFRNVNMYYSGGVLGSSNYGAISIASQLSGSNGNSTDPIYYGNTYLFRDPFSGVQVTYRLTYKGTYERTVRLSGTSVVHVNKSDWTGYFLPSSKSECNVLKAGDFILTSGLFYQDQFSKIYAPTYPVGIIQEIRHDTVLLTNVAYGIRNGMTLHLWMDYFVNENAFFTGDIAAGSNTFRNVQGAFPSVGDRPDIPILPAGSYVTEINPSARTISFSNANNSTRSFMDQTIVNGYPTIEMFSAYDPPYLQKFNKNLIGGAQFYQSESTDVNIRPTDFLLDENYIRKYKILNTNFHGDTSLHKLKYQVLSGPAGN
ncbi:MAG TPA: glycosyl hydrolase family 28-related protein [Puia sp.]|jgi:hypothetical protein